MKYLFISIDSDPYHGGKENSESILNSLNKEFNLSLSNPEFEGFGISTSVIGVEKIEDAIQTSIREKLNSLYENDNIRGAKFRLKH